MARKKQRKPDRVRKPKQKAQREPAASPKEQDGQRVASVVLALVAFALYANSIPNEYALDDTIAISQNRFTQAGISGIGDLLTSDAMLGFSVDFIDEVGGGRYRPLSLVTFAIEQEAFTGNPHISHAINALLYAVCVVFIYRLFVTLLVAAPPRPWPLSAAFLAALIFAAHPVHTEVVSNIKGRDELLSLAGAVACLWLGVRSSRTTGRRPLIVSAVIFFLALLSKENSITMLAIVPLTVWFFRPSQLALLRTWMPMLIAAALLFIAIRQSIVLSNSGGDELLNNPFLGASLADRYATIFYTLALYLKLLVVPYPLTFDYYPYHVPILSWADWRAWLGLVVNMGLVAIALAAFRRRSVVAYGIAFYIVTMSITSNLLFSIGTFMGERFLFMPSVGACLIAGWGLAEGTRHVARDSRTHAVTVVVIMAIVLVPFTTLTLARNRVWKDNFTLTTTDVLTSTNGALANATAAQNLLFAASELDDPSQKADFERRARTYLEKALEIHPRYKWATRALAHYHSERGEVDRAIAYYEQLYELKPSTAFGVGTFILHYRKERALDAARYLELAVASDPNDVKAIGNLAVAYFYVGDLRRSAETVERALALSPNDPGLTLNLAQLYHALGDERFEQLRAKAEGLGAKFEPLDDVDLPTEPEPRPTKPNAE